MVLNYTKSRNAGKSTCSVPAKVANVVPGMLRTATYDAQRLRPRKFTRVGSASAQCARLNDSSCRLLALIEYSTDSMSIIDFTCRHKA